MEVGQGIGPRDMPWDIGQDTGPEDRVRNGTTHDLPAQAGQGSAQGLTKGQGRAGHFGTQCSKIHRGCVPTARGCVAKWDAVSMLKCAMLDSAAKLRHFLAVQRFTYDA